MESNTFESLQIGLASPDRIREWSYGVVERPETINYRTQKPETGGLYCERIFGPTKDWECHCGKFKKIRFKGKVCDRCGVEVTRAKVRRERMGHIELAAPVSHIWYFKGTPSRIGQVLEISQKRLEEVLYFTKYVVIEPGETSLLKNQLLTEKEYLETQEQYGDTFIAEMGAEAVQWLLDEYDPDSYVKFFEMNMPLISRVIGLSEQEIHKYLHRFSYYVEEAGESGYHNGDVISYAEYKEMILPYNRKCEDDTNTPAQVKTGFAYMLELFDQNFDPTDEEFATVRKENWIGDLQYTANGLKEELRDLPNGQKKIKLLKRLEIVEAFLQSGNKPSWMVMNVVPVIPPDLRPMVMLDGGRYATSDLNDLYRRVINRNNRLQRMLKLEAPDIIVRNEKRMLQEAVDALIDNGRHGRPVTGPNNRALKSLSDMLKGKQGRFRQNLLGKRVDYSGRSVIVVGPELKMYQCGLPKEMALELFKPFVLKRLVDTGVIANIKSARKIVDRATDKAVWDALEHVIKSHPVLLNRAPTLHRLGIQAFEPILVEGRALKLHPLVCSAFNADFDGDQMAVHLPLSAEAQAEARFLMLAANNLLKPSDGRPVAVPSQDMVLGSYYLTLLKEDDKGAGKCFRDVDEAMMAYYEGDVTLHAPIKVRITKDVAEKKLSKIIDCTIGRLIFNENIPQNLGYVDRTNSERQFDLEVSFLVKKGKLSEIIDRCIKIHGTTTTSEVLDKIKALGFKYSTRSGITTAVCDATIPPQKKDILKAADEKIDEINDHYNMGYISADEKSKLVVETWNRATDEVTDALKANMDPYNPIQMMADSGARGSIAQLRQLAGMRGLIANTSGTTIEIPIRANYREGLNILEYFISSRGARKGLADTALRTADSGYLTRRLVDVSQDVIIREQDCGTEDGIDVYEIRNGTELIEPMRDRLAGRFLCHDLRDAESGELIVSKDKLLTERDAQRIAEMGIERIKIRSVLKCKAKQGVCAKCYGANLANNNLVSVGEAVGIIAAQSIGEPGTQLTMRTFHTGGIASGGEGDITQGLPRVEELFEARKPKNAAIIASIDGTIHLEEIKTTRTLTIHNYETGEEEVQTIPYNYKYRVKEGDVVRKGDRLTEGNVFPSRILEVLDTSAVQDYIIIEVQKVYRLQGVDINDKHIEVIVRQMLRKVKVEDAGSSNELPGVEYLLPGTLVDRKRIDEVNERIRQCIEAGQVDLTPVTTSPVLQGITKAASSSESFMSAASFQETTKALTDAAIRGKVDHLEGLKENVIIGKLIPAGTGMDIYNNVQLVKTAKAEPAPEHTAAPIPNMI
ncbi:MAG: DNA-directed RNA polymerase subunit beta' [Oscillospiraceae bacterium]|nr:DNA-directed RNA polymerase subunit beta' [Oscillospiraceae bacterium]